MTTGEDSEGVALGGRACAREMVPRKGVPCACCCDAGPILVLSMDSTSVDSAPEANESDADRPRGFM